MTRREVWKDVPNYEGMYQVSNRRRVRGLERVLSRSNGTTYRCRPTMMRLRVHPVSGTRAVTLAYFGGRQTVNVDRLAAELFQRHR